MIRNMHYVLLLTACLSATVAAESDRQGRQIFQQLTSHSTVVAVQYQLCEKEGILGACLPSAVCQQQGKFIGYCGNSDNYCCKVIKTCGGRTTSHQAYFRNPNYPGRDSEARVCPFEMDIGKEVCGVRLYFDFFELAKFESGVCIRDTLTVLGSASTKFATTPVCGNLTNWATTFAVKSGSRVTLAMVLQGMPSYKFSVRVTQLPCGQITTFHSPTYAGVKNVNAPPYTPTTTPAPTEEPGTTPTDFPTEPTTLIPDPTTDVPTTDVPTTLAPGVDPKPTTLTPGKLPVPKHDKVVIKAEQGESPPVLEGVDSVPAISAFKRAFELEVNDRFALKVNERCWQYEDESDAGFRIIGGSNTNINEYPWQVALVYKKKFFCGGSLISDRHILTASHCIFGSFSKGIHEVVVSIGDHDLATRDETNHTVGRVKSINWNIHYNPHTTHNDIAILELQEPVEFDQYKNAVRLPTDLDEDYLDANATITGWGRFNIRHKKTNTILKEYTGPLLNTSACVEAWNKFPGINAELDQHVCLDITLGTPCHGDSGGPLVVCSGGAHCTQVGVVSFGFPLCTNVGLPAVFARVTHFKSWLDMTTHPLSVLHV
ncbi:serine protease filzig-like [Eriocheir sinensis]|uniref:serine protease filzig-like n=1 Tax=Eriocheir sinensis TaxID=95602 RepID=UPI0021C8E079|nr:serine protease filzig-like [Eriocheir sinensis]XP_050716496.1 serine protease filzig-like [Eriocheir sinensis]